MRDYVNSTVKPAANLGTDLLTRARKIAIINQVVYAGRLLGQNVRLPTKPA